MTLFPSSIILIKHSNLDDPSDEHNIYIVVQQMYKCAFSSSV